MPIHPAQRPAPIRTDENAFAFATMTQRVPGILRDVLDDPDLSAASQRALDDLHAALTGDALIPMLAADPAPAPDYDDWAAAYADQRARQGELHWLRGEWFFAETFIYRHLLQAVRWHETGRDPFRRHKESELAQPRFRDLLAAALERPATAQTFADQLPDLLALALWGNRVDLSHPAGTLAAGAVTPDDLLIDDRARVLPVLESGGGTVHLIADNAGTELAMDLVLIDALLAVGCAVTLHVKAHPIFVSDTTLPDVWHVLEAMQRLGSAPAALADRLRAAWDSGRWRLAAHPFWTGSRFWPQMPGALRSARGSARLVIVKGDANYRRIIDDADWPPGATLADALDGFPAPVLALRTLKSDALVGVDPARLRPLDANGPAWRSTGRYGIIQFAAPESSIEEHRS